MSQKLNSTSVRLYNIINASCISLKALIEQYAGAKAEEWRLQVYVSGISKSVPSFDFLSIHKSHHIEIYNSKTLNVIEIIGFHILKIFA